MLNQDIDRLIMEATKNRAPELEIYKLIKCEFVNAQKAGMVLDDLTEAKILLKMAAQRKDSIEQFIGGGRPELAENEKKELTVIEGFIPAQPTNEDIAEHTLGVIGAYKMTKPEGYTLSMRDMKPIMTLVQEKYPMASGKVISQTFQNFLRNKL